jgi:hypothetical protein
MGMQFSMKYINEIMITLIAVTSIAVLASATMMVSGVKSLAVASGEAASVPVSVPLLSRKMVDYSQDEYKALVKKMDAEPAIKVEALPGKLVISAQNLSNESQWRRAVADALALDKNLHAQKVCGTATNACSGSALMAEVVGVHQVFFINNNEGVGK